MGQVVTDVTVNDQGQLVVWFGPCCSRVLGLTTAVFGSEQNRDSELPADLQPDTETNDVRCQKAGIITRILADMSAKLYASFMDPISHPYRPALTGAYGGVSFDWIDMALAFTIGGWSAFADDALSEENYLMSSYKCKLAAVFANTWEVTKEDFTAMKSMLTTVFDLDTDGKLHSIIDSVGRGDWSSLVMAEMPNAVTYNCDCPDLPPLPDPDQEETAPTTGGWYIGPVLGTLVASKPDGNAGAEARLNYIQVPHDCFGWVFESEVTSLTGTIYVQGKNAWSYADHNSVMHDGLGRLDTGIYYLCEQYTVYPALNAVVPGTYKNASFGGSSYGANPASPAWPVTANKYGAVYHLLTAVANPATGTTRVKCRPIYNINSPSHGA